MGMNSEKWYEKIRLFIDTPEDHDKKDAMRNFLLGSLLYKHVTAINISAVCDDKEILKEYKKVTAKNVSIPVRANKNERAKIDRLFALYKELIKNNHIEEIDSDIDSVNNIKCFYELWIEQALAQIVYVTQATHVAKLTHSSSGGSSVVDSIKEVNDSYLTTSSLEEVIYDGAYPDAVFSRIAKFLLISVDGVVLGDALKAGNMKPLEKFVNQEKLQVWRIKFINGLNPTPKADSLAKQIYFPINKQQDNYHLLVVLHSSSLIQSIYNQYFHKEARKTYDKVYKLKEKEKYGKEFLYQIPNSIALSTVMSQPQNVSVNSGSRGGNIRVFSGAPPTWKTQLKPPIHSRSMFFEKKLNYFAMENIKGLQDMLIRFDTANISFKEPKRLKGVTNWVEAVANDVIDYSQVVSALPSGWTNSTDCRLPIAHQIFLDFKRGDAEFIQQKQQNDWQKQLVIDFVAWLNSKLRHRRKGFYATDAHSRIWRNVFKDILREHVELLKKDFSSTGSDEEALA